MSKRVPGLRELLQAASLDSYISQAELWCDQAGAVDLSEILDVEESFADALGLKLLERRRLHKCVVTAGATPPSSTCGIETAERPSEVQPMVALAEPDSEPASLQAKEEEYVPSTLTAGPSGSFYSNFRVKRPTELQCVSALKEGVAAPTPSSSFYATKAWEDTIERTSVTDKSPSTSELETNSTNELLNTADADLRRQRIENRKKDAKWNFSGLSGYSHSVGNDRFREHESLLQQQRLKAFHRRSEVEGEEQAERALNQERQARQKEGLYAAGKADEQRTERGFIFDKPFGPPEQPRQLFLPNEVNFTWAATWWGIRVNQVKSASTGLHLDDFIVEVAGISVRGLEEDACEKIFQSHLSGGVPVLVEPSCSCWGTFPHADVDWESMQADLVALQVDYGVSVEVCPPTKLLLRGAQSAILGAQEAIEILMASYYDAGTKPAVKVQ